MQNPHFRHWLALLLIVVVALIASMRLQMSYDLGAFLPAPETSAQTLLSQRLGQGPGAQLIFIELNACTTQQARDIALALRTIPKVANVLPQDVDLSVGGIPAAIWQQRLLLQDLPTDRAQWADILNERVDDISFAADDDTLELIAADPALLSIAALDNLTSGASEPAYNQGETQYLIIETDAPAFDLNGQATLLSALRKAIPAQHSARLLGSPVYAVDLQNDVRWEATLFSTLAGLALLLLMIVKYRSVNRVIGVALPLAAGGAVGLLILTLTFPAVHGITIAFGFTLLGVAIDYPLHLFTHADQAGSSKQHSIWPVLRLGITSTLIAYGAFIFSGTTGLQQLGVFAFSGIVTAALVAAWITTGTSVDSTPIHQDQTPVPVVRHPQKLRFLPATIVLTCALAGLASTETFNDDLSSLTPIDKSLLAADADLRRRLGVTDIRYLISVRGTDQQETLRRTEVAMEQLSALEDSGELLGTQSITHILPSEATQQQRRLRLQNDDVLRAFSDAVADAPLDEAAFTPFLQSWQQNRNNKDYLTLAMLQQDQRLAGLADSLFYPDKQSWVSLIFLRGIEDPSRIGKLFDNSDGIELVDLKLTSEQMVGDYRTNLLSILMVAIALIVLVLTVRLNLRKSAWLTLNTAAAVSFAAACSATLQGGLSLFDLMALTLVAGLGLDYVLFYSRDRAATEDAATASAVLLCTMSSLIVFGILSLSSIPVLQGIGTTVSAGVITAYLLARFGRYANPGR